VDFAKEAFKCWHAGCSFRGYRQTLEKRLGLRQRLSPAERQERQRVLSESQRAAEWLAAQLRARRFRLYQVHQALLTIIFGASDRLRRDSCDEVAWSGLVYAYPQIDSARAELALLESAPVETRIAFLDNSPASRKENLRTVIEHGGLFDSGGRFIEIETHCPGMLTGD